MTNRLAHSNSPYLLQHQDNPVDWHPWGEKALSRAKAEDKPIFLSIGYAACHWCHVMAHESFEDEATAALMNEHFINIKVDREERPDIDGIYMDAIVALTGSGGWPMSVFLTPEGEPFLGGTYYPPVARHNLPSFTDLLHHVNRLWTDERDKVHEVGQQLIERIQNSNLSFGDSGNLDVDLLDKAAMGLAQNYDWQQGGWGRAPKFPQAMAIDFLLARANVADKLSLDVATHALTSMARGGMYDLLGGGFSRYSVDDRWLVPHFEKMLYDNALLSRAYLHAYLVTGEVSFRKVCEDTLDFVTRELGDDGGGFYSSLDADSEGEEGKFYVWSLAEINDLVADDEKRALLIAAYGISEAGNFEGQNILQRLKDNADLSKDFKISEQDVEDSLEEMHTILFATRAKRIRPGTDDKAITSWNALMMLSFAEAGRYLKRPDYIEIAKKNAEFLLSELVFDSRLLRSWREGQAAHNAYLEDYAALILGLLALYQSDPNPLWFAEAQKLGEEMVAHFQDPNGGFFDTRDDHEKLIARPKEVQDNATPSGNALAALALLQLSSYSGQGDLHDRAVSSLSGMQNIASQHPTAFAQWLAAMSFTLAEGREIALLGDLQSSELNHLQNVLWEKWRPYDLAAISSYPPVDGSPALLNARPLLDGKANAYVCQHFVCKRPVNSPKDFAEQLEIT
jgi:uncharacterized protein YyaL (SSP411 family)